eukprot:CAMPEP_0170740138 /NCGR_PEP_ID=MMETSP0437-20130122/5526_1 /TAXON_ID=0 /ORGANISM="Sexangularia sp." /LENGTH=411 /DNA_ID=CAMNT_0011078623 /DNA_START=11 /DNA_END=1242 /DNA_ORIENTATION=+
MSKPLTQLSIPIFTLISIAPKNEESSQKRNEYPPSPLPLPTPQPNSIDKPTACQGLFFTAGGGGAARTGVKNLGHLLTLVEGIPTIVDTLSFASEAPSCAVAGDRVLAVAAGRTIHLLRLVHDESRQATLVPAWSQSFDTLLGAQCRPADEDEDDTELSSLALSPDESVLAIGSRKGELVLLNLDSFQPTHTLANHAEPLTGLAFSPSGAQLALVTDAKVSLLSLSLCDTLFTLRPEGRAAAPAPGQPLVRVRGFHWLTDELVLLGEMRPSVRRSPGFSRLRILHIPSSPDAAPRTVSNITAHSSEHHTALVTGMTEDGPVAVTVTAQGNAATFSLTHGSLRRLSATSVFPDDSVATAVAISPAHPIALVGSANRLVVPIPLVKKSSSYACCSVFIAIFVIFVAMFVQLLR